MLDQDEELFEKQIPANIEVLLSQDRDPLADRNELASKLPGKKARDKYKVVTFRVPHNAAVQIYDYKEKKARLAPIQIFLLRK